MNIHYDIIIPSPFGGYIPLLRVISYHSFCHILSNCKYYLENVTIPIMLRPYYHIEIVPLQAFVLYRLQAG